MSRVYYVVGVLSLPPPSTTPADPVGSLPTYGEHLANLFNFQANKIASARPFIARTRPP